MSDNNINYTNTFIGCARPVCMQHALHAWHLAMLASMVHCLLFALLLIGSVFAWSKLTCVSTNLSILASFHSAVTRVDMYMTCDVIMKNIRSRTSTVPPLEHKCPCGNSSGYNSA